MEEKEAIEDIKEEKRNPDTDAAIEARFGKPDWSQSFIRDGYLWTPIGNYKLWRID